MVFISILFSFCREFFNQLQHFSNGESAGLSPMCFKLNHSKKFFPLHSRLLSSIILQFLPCNIESASLPKIFLEAFINKAIVSRFVWVLKYHNNSYFKFFKNRIWLIFTSWAKMFLIKFVSAFDWIFNNLNPWTIIKIYWNFAMNQSSRFLWIAQPSKLPL